MSTAIFGADYTSFLASPSVGFGSDFLRLKKFNEKTAEEFRQAETLGRLNETLQSLDKVFQECSSKGWDGYDASSITKASYIEAFRFIECLPLTSSIPMPEIVPEPSGEIALEWFKGSRQIFVASLNGKTEIIYAGLFGTNKTHGTEYFGDTLPDIIIENLKRLYY